MGAYIFDTETTGLDAPEVIEAAWLAVDIHGETVAPGGEVSRWRPSKPITLGAMATHLIMDEDLVDLPPSSAFKLPEGVDYLIGFNIDFDWRAIGEPDVKRIDVCAMCRALWPDADSHSQSAMMFLLHRDDARRLLREAHSAAADVYNCSLLLRDVLAKAGPFETFEQLWQASERMRIPTKFTFGKHRGMLIKDAPRDYCAWMLRQPDIDPYLRIALGRR